MKIPSTKNLSSLTSLVSYDSLRLCLLPKIKIKAEVLIS